MKPTNMIQVKLSEKSSQRHVNEAGKEWSIRLFNPIIDLNSRYDNEYTISSSVLSPFTKKTHAYRKTCKKRKIGESKKLEEVKKNHLGNNHFTFLKNVPSLISEIMGEKIWGEIIQYLEKSQAVPLKDSILSQTSRYLKDVQDLENLLQNTEFTTEYEDIELQCQSKLIHKNCQERMFRRLYCNPCHSTAYLRSCGRTFLVPRRASFVMCNLFEDRLWAEVLRSKFEHFKLIVMDPPWPNKSAQRAKRYKTLPHHGLKAIAGLPIPLVMGKECIVAVWVTNDPKIQRFVLEDLFPKWKLQYSATWVWLKVTTTGELVTDIDDLRRKPYEKVIIGSRQEGHGESQGKASGAVDFLKLKNHVVCSVPMHHSWKPSLESLFTGVIPDLSNCNKLETFARELRPGWTSIGNEPLYFQDVRAFEKKKSVLQANCPKHNSNINIEKTINKESSK